VQLALNSESFMHRWKVGLSPAKPAYRKQRRRALGDRQTRRRQRSITTALSRSELSADAIVPLGDGPALILILMLSLALWATVWGPMTLAVSALS
jgi:hypothetical protein